MIRRRQHAFCRRQVARREVNDLFPILNRFDDVGDFAVFADTEECVHFRDCVDDFLLVPFGQTARNDDFEIAFLFLFDKFQNGVDGFLLAFFDKRAGIDKYYVGFVFVRRKFDTGVARISKQVFGIDAVFIATETYYPEFNTHCPSSGRSNSVESGFSATAP